MIYLLSDLHGEWKQGLAEYLERYQKGDLLIVLGDVGLKFEKNQENELFTQKFLRIDKPIAIIDGNHDNHAYLNAFPQEEWCGGTVNRLSEYIVRLRRGQIFQVQGKTLFVMGGCKSSAIWKEKGLWYEGEEPTCEEVLSAYSNLRLYGNKVDYILTHKYHPDMQSDDEAGLDGLKEYIDGNVTFKHWYAGHWHKELVFDERHTIVYDKLFCIE